MSGAGDGRMGLSVLFRLLAGQVRDDALAGSALQHVVDELVAFGYVAEWIRAAEIGLDIVGPPDCPPGSDAVIRISPRRTMAVEIEQVSDVTDEIVDAFARLVPQLSRSAPPVTVETLRTVVDCPANTLFVARLDGRVVGTLTLVVFPIPTGVRGWIEDVVVDAEARGQQAGATLTRAAMDRAAELGARTVDLTSRASREAANRLYRNLGFEERDSNLLRYTPIDRG
ncbi:GNAT family N-acetyltransferase [Rhodococcus sp. SJ-2]